MQKTILIGIGGAGKNVLYSLSCRHQAARILLINRAEHRPKQSDGDFLPIANTVKTFKQSRQKVIKSRTAIGKAMHGCQQVVVMAGLGGVTGTGILPVVIQLALAQKIPVIAAVTLPFAFENNRLPIAKNALAELELLGVPLLVHDNAAQSEPFREQSMADYLTWANQQIDQQISALIA